MGQPPLARPASGGLPHGDTAEPATVAFRRPERRGAAPAMALATPRRPHFEVLLRLPDLNAVVPVPAAPLAEGSNPLVGKLMWCATGILAIIAIMLLSTGKPESPRPLEPAPRWRAEESDPAATETAPAAPGVRLAPNGNASDLIGAAESGQQPASGGPWRAGAQLVQPHDGSELEGNLPADQKPPGSASWPGDAWPGGYPDTAAPGHDPASTPPAGSYPYPSTAPTDGTDPPAGPPGVDSAEPQYDPWPGPPQWPADARRGAAPVQSPIRTANRPDAQSTGPGTTPAAQLEGGIRNMDMSPSYDGTRSSVH